MRIEKITVRVGRTIPGPEYGGGQYANVKPEVELTVILDAGEDVAAARAGLTAAALRMLEEVTNELIGGGKIAPKPTYAPNPPQPVAVPQPMNVGGAYPAVTPPPSW